MSTIQGAYYTMDAARFGHVVLLARVTRERACEIALDTDWMEGQEHQDWLDTAPAAEIASWLADIASTGGA